MEDAQAKSDELQQQLQYAVLLQQHAPASFPNVNMDTVAAAIQQLWKDASDAFTAASAEHSKLVHDLDEMRKNKKVTGPCASSLESVLQTHNVDRQAFHGGAFVGNHVHRTLQPAVLRALMSAPVEVVSTRCQQLVADAEILQQRYHGLFSGYADCSHRFSHCNSMSEADISKLADCIQLFLQKCRESIITRQLGNITPKLHLLEERTVPFTRKFGVGQGRLAEQGSESIHARFNRLSFDYNAIPGTLQRLTAMCQQHLVGTLPQHDAVRPATASRKRKASELEQ